MPFPGNSLKRVKIYHESHIENTGGSVYVLGEGDMGQLGLGEDKLEAKKPFKVPNLPSNMIQVASGGVHSACLTNDGRVYTWGCNDDGALGRLTESKNENENVIDEYRADRVKNLINNQKIVQISCGDSHTAALTDDGQVYIWGTFRNANGNIGLLKEKCTERFPVNLRFPYTNEKPIIIKIASGNNHLCCLSSDGRLFTLGNWEQGQLGRDYEKDLKNAEEFVSNNNDETLYAGEDNEDEDKEKTYFQKCLELYLKPIAIEISNYIKFDDCWAGSYCTFARTKKTKEIYACGLNNYYQLNIDPKCENRLNNDNLIIKEFTIWKGLQLNRELKNLFGNIYVNNIASGEHHTLIACNNGSLFSIGNHNYGRLGLGNINNEVHVPNLSPVFNSHEKKIKKIATSASSVLGISEDNRLYGWGMADCYQITFKDDTYLPTLIQQINGECIDCSVGAQHSLFIVK